MKKILDIFMALLLSVGFISCSIIDDAEPDYNFGEIISEPVFLYGTWDECTADGVLKEDYRDKEVYHLTFTSEHKLYMKIVRPNVEQQVVNQEYYFRCAGTPEKGGIYMNSDYDSYENAARFEFVNGLLKIEKVYYRKR